MAFEFWASYYARSIVDFMLARSRGIVAGTTGKYIYSHRDAELTYYHFSAWRMALTLYVRLL